MEIIKDNREYLINSNNNNKLVETFKDYSSLLNNKEGLEIGGPSIFFNSSGIYTSPKKLDNVIFTESTLWSITKI